MSSQKNCFEDLICSFKQICTALERKAELDLKQVQKDCEEEFSSNVKSLRKFNEVVAGISETCSELVNNNDILKTATIINKNENAINLPYDMHSDVVKCMSELFNLTPLGRSAHGDELISDKSVELVSELIRTCQKNVHDVKEIENTIVEAKEII